MLQPKRDPFRYTWPVQVAFLLLALGFVLYVGWQVKSGGLNEGFMAFMGVAPTKRMDIPLTPEPSTQPEQRRAKVLPPSDSPQADD